MDYKLSRIWKIKKKLIIHIKKIDLIFSIHMTYCFSSKKSKKYGHGYIHTTLKKSKIKFPSSIDSHDIVKKKN